MPSSTMSRAAATAIAALWVLAIADSRSGATATVAAFSGNVDAPIRATIVAARPTT